MVGAPCGVSGSGLSTAAFCRKRGLSYAQFMCWQRLLAAIENAIRPVTLGRNNVDHAIMRSGSGDAGTNRDRHSCATPHNYSWSRKASVLSVGRNRRDGTAGACSRSRACCLSSKLAARY